MEKPCLKYMRAHTHPWLDGMMHLIIIEPFSLGLVIRQPVGGGGGGASVGVKGGGTNAIYRPRPAARAQRKCDRDSMPNPTDGSHPPRLGITSPSHHCVTIAALRSSTRFNQNGGKGGGDEERLTKHTHGKKR